MNYERQKRLVEGLLDRTRSGQIAWQEGVGSGTFQVAFPNNAVQITALNGYDGESFSISIIDGQGRIAESFTDQDLDRDGPHLSGSWADMMDELFNGARRYALRADEVLDSILSEIDYRPR